MMEISTTALLRSSLLAVLLATAGLFDSGAACAQQASTARPTVSGQPANAEFSATADEVLQEMSKITGLKLRAPLKKTLRSREEIHAYVIKQMDEEKNAGERYAGARSAEAFGLIPKGFNLDAFMIDLLTEQIAGLYDPKAHEFYIADWIPVEDQRMVMAHELTHALEDQYFEIEKWVKAARPNDDAELARESVLEGSAMAAMVDYILLGSGHSLRDFPTLDPTMLAGDLADSPTMKKAPPFLKDALVFPYLEGLTFSTAILRPAGWSGLPAVFAKPPASTQQILHPELYSAGKTAVPVTIPSIDKELGPGWTKLEENTMGEFGWKEILKQFLGEEKAKPTAAAWEADRYLVYEEKQSKRLVLVARLRLANVEQTQRFFEQYSEALLKKHDSETHVSRKPSFLSFDTADGSVFLRCAAAECITVEGTSRPVFEAVSKAVGWPAFTAVAAEPSAERPPQN
jgi:hypothetical protein